MPHYERDLRLSSKLRSAAGCARARNNLACAYEDQAYAASTAALAADAAAAAAAEVEGDAAAQIAGLLSAQARAQAAEAQAAHAQAVTAADVAAGHRRAETEDEQRRVACGAPASAALQDVARGGGHSAMSNPALQLTCLVSCGDEQLETCLREGFDAEAKTLEL